VKKRRRSEDAGINTNVDAARSPLTVKMILELTSRIRMSELSELSVVEAARAIREGEISAEALAKALIDRTERHKNLDAFVSFDPDFVRECARHSDQRRAQGHQLGALHGVPICLKDNINTASMPTTACTPALRGHRPAVDAPVAAALFNAGAILFGKNTMHELAFGVTCNNSSFGTPRNPYDARMIAGGSSGGTAVAVAARLSQAGIGTDTGGSVRVPAALCGLAGLRPTVQRWSQDGIVPISATRDTAGPLSRSISDLALLDSVVTGDEGPISMGTLRGVRLGMPLPYFWENLEDETARLCREAVAVLKESGAVIVETDIPDVANLNDAVSFVVALYEPAANISSYLLRSGAKVTFEEIVAEVGSRDVQAITRSMTNVESRVPLHVYNEAIERHRPNLVQAYKSSLVDNSLDAMIYPTVPMSSRPIGADDTVDLCGQQVPTFATFIRNTDPGSNAGFPGITLPVGLTSTGLPVGLSLEGLPLTDRSLLALASKLEAILPALPAPRIG
jgi:mandelamide amidase